MKKSTICFLFAILVLTNLTGQNQAPNWILNQPIQGGNHEYEAIEYIKLMPGFSYTPSAPADKFGARINPFILFPPEDGITGGPWDGDNGVVGNFDGVLQVNDIGAATYTIPLSFPSGVAGLTPGISIVYNSNSGNGLLGVGWSIGGLSAISRTGSTVYHDGILEGIRLNDEDNFMLDGNRLIKVDGTGNEYRTEIESFSKIVLLESNSNGPQSFRVNTKDGRTLHYGRTENSRHKPKGKQQVVSWYLGRVEDVNGNYIDYEYSQTNGEMRIASIKYGGNLKTGQAHIYKIQFHYTCGRGDANTTYIAGGSFDLYCNLGGITTSLLNENEYISIYDFEYDWIGLYVRLKKITPTVLGKTLNPIKFEWGEEGEDFSTNVWLSGGSKRDIFWGDFNGNGRTDLILAYYTGSESNKQYTYAAVSYTMPCGTIFTSPQYVCDISDEPTGGYNFAQFLVGDFNGNGRDDLVKVRIKETIGGMFDFRLSMFLSNEEGFNVAHYNFPQHLGYYPDFRVTDLNGNGFSEILIHSPQNENTNAIFAYELCLNTNTFVSLFANPPSTVGFFYQHNNTGSIKLFPITPGDFTGNGKTDLLVNTKPSESLILSLDESTNQLVSLTAEPMGYPTKWHRVYTGDFNGDGITDILTYAFTNPNVNWELKHADGQGNWKTGNNPITRTLDPGNPSNNLTYYIADFNGSGKSDILEIYMPYDSHYQIFYSKGNNFASAIETIPHGESLSLLFSVDRAPVLDFNGDGKNQLFMFTCCNLFINSYTIMSFQNGSNFNLVHSFINSFGAKTTIEYNPITNTNYANIYTKQCNAQYPIIDIQVPLYVVTKVKHEINNQLVTTATYKYEGAKLHRQGKGFLGFQRREISDLLTGLTTVSTNSIYKPNNKFLFPYNDSLIVYKSGSMDILSETLNTLNHKAFGYSDIAFFPYTERTSSHKVDYNTLNHMLSSRNYYSYDNQGNLVQTKEVVHPEYMPSGAPDAAFHHQTDVSYEYYPPDFVNWIIGQPKKITTQVRYQWNNPIIKSAVEFEYYQQGDDNFPLLKRKTSLPEDNPDDVLVTTTLHEYDPYGNLTKQTIAAPNDSDLSEKQIQFDYDAEYQHRFPTAKINAAGHITTYEYDPILGWETATTSVNNHATTYEHAPFGINSAVVMPDGFQNKTAKRWAQGHDDSPANALYYIWSQVSGEPEVITFYNNNGQELRTVTIGFDGGKIYTDMEYNNKGLLWRISLPYKPEDQMYFTAYSYDQIGRNISVAYPDGTTTSTEYIGDEIRVKNQLNQISVSKYNAVGWLIESTDYGGNVVVYDYYADGKLKTAQIGNNSATMVNLEYNTLRQRILINDPNYGIQESFFNAYGQLYKTINPKEETTEFEYDILGRKRIRTDLEGTTQWIYEETNPGKIGVLLEITDGYHRTSFEYDDLLRVTAITEYHRNDLYRTENQYDLLGRLIKKKYPSDFAVNYYYNEYGFLESIREFGGNLLWQTNTVNSIGQIESYKTGNNLNTHMLFNPLTFRPEAIITQRTGHNPVQDLEFAWDDYGNLNHRRKWINRTQNLSLTESFEYDNLNRLEKVRLNGHLRGLHDYDQGGLGNIIFKIADSSVLFDDAIYGSNAGPHALTSMTSSPSLFPEPEQSIAYNTFNKITSIGEGSKTLTIIYRNMSGRHDPASIPG